MPRLKKPAKPEPTVEQLAAAIGVTVERYRRDAWARDKPEVRDGARIEHPPRRISRIKQWVRDGWVDKLGAVALEFYEEMVEQANYGHARSCLDNTPVGHGDGGVPRAVSYAREELARLRNAVVSGPDRGYRLHALMVTHEMIFSTDNVENSLAAILKSGGRNARKANAKSLVSATAYSIAVFLEHHNRHLTDRQRYDFKRHG